MNDAHLQAILAHAAEVAPAECCGLIAKGEYHRCTNLAADQTHFVIGSDDIERFNGSIEAVVHSHPFASPEPTTHDRVACERSRLPWIIVSHPSSAYREILPCGYRAPLIGREFFHGSLDCYGLVRDYYFEKLGVDLLDFWRMDEWWNRGESLLVDNYEKAGFILVCQPLASKLKEFLREIRPHDVIFMQRRAPVPNHCAVYQGEGKILHHCMGALSKPDIYGGYWHSLSTHHLRHQSLI